MADIHRIVADRGSLTHTIIHSVNLTDETDFICSQPLNDVVFLGCTLQPKALAHINACGSLVFPEMKLLPYKTFRSTLYTPDELMEGYKATEKG